LDQPGSGKSQLALDLLCANCHSMAHRNPKTVLPIEEWQRLIQAARRRHKR
jgi:predicted HNH restriction endonuclease